MADEKSWRPEAMGWAVLWVRSPVPRQLRAPSRAHCNTTNAQRHVNSRALCAKRGINASREYASHGIAPLYFRSKHGSRLHRLSTCWVATHGSANRRRGTTRGAAQNAAAPGTAMRATKQSKEGVKYRSANGGLLPNVGEKVLESVTEGTTMSVI